MVYLGFMEGGVVEFMVRLSWVYKLGINHLKILYTSSPCPFKGESDGSQGRRTLRALINIGLPWAPMGTCQRPCSASNGA